jgi:hypothetical protein
MGDRNWICRDEPRESAPRDHREVLLSIEAASVIVEPDVDQELHVRPPRIV